MFTRINRGKLLASVTWTSRDFDNRNHNNQISLAFGRALPAENGVYIGADCFSLWLFAALVVAGFSLTEAARVVRDDYKKWVHGLERIEWPELFPPPEPTPWAPTPRGLATGITTFLDTEIYFATAKTPNGDIRTACGTMAQIVQAIMVPLVTAQPGIPVNCIPLRGVYEQTLAAAKQAGVDLGAPFTRPEGHPEHVEWIEAVAEHRALSKARQKMRKPPGPPPIKGKQRRPAAAEMQRERA